VPPPLGLGSQTFQKGVQLLEVGTEHRGAPSALGQTVGALHRGHREGCDREPDGSFRELRRRFEEDDAVSVPATVYNAVLNRMEEV
jgi:hypothetical protein